MSGLVSQDFSRGASATGTTTTAAKAAPAMMRRENSAGSGWINNWGACSYEFLTGGDCVTVTMQYSYLPSVFA